MAVELMPHQTKAVSELGNGKILRGGTGVGKTITSLAYYYTRECGGTLNKRGTMTDPKNLVVITTARKRNSYDWEQDAAMFGIFANSEHSPDDVNITVDSWNNIEKYDHLEDTFFIFDEQKVVGAGVWATAFVKIAKRNPWILLSATPGDTWLDYIPVFLANGFYKNRTEFKRRHVVYNTYAKFPKVDRYTEVGVLIRNRNKVLVEMPYLRHTTPHDHKVEVAYDQALFKKVMEDRWHVYEERPLRDVAELFSVMRKVVNSDSSRIEAVRGLMEKHPKLIVFYNFDYELEMLRTLTETSSRTSDPLLATRLESTTERSISSKKTDHETPTTSADDSTSHSQKTQKTAGTSTSTPDSLRLNSSLTTPTHSTDRTGSPSSTSTSQHPSTKTLSRNVRFTNSLESRAGHGGLLDQNSAKDGTHLIGVTARTATSDDVGLPNECDMWGGHWSEDEGYGEEFSRCNGDEQCLNELYERMAPATTPYSRGSHQDTRSVGELEISADGVTRHILSTSGLSVATSTKSPSRYISGSAANSGPGSMLSSTGNFSMETVKELQEGLPSTSDQSQDIPSISPSTKSTTQESSTTKDSEWTKHPEKNSSLSSEQSQTTNGSGSKNSSNSTTTSSESLTSSESTPLTDSSGTEATSDSFTVAEYNGHKHEPIPDTDRWVYLVQYKAGAEAWNCVDTNAVCFYSQTYSYKDHHQCKGRIDRLNTLFTDLHYYMLVSKSYIDEAIAKSLGAKESFNERKSGIKFKEAA